MLIDFIQQSLRTNPSAPSQRGLSATADWGSVLPLEAHPLHRFAVPLPLWGRRGELSSDDKRDIKI